MSAKIEVTLEKLKMPVVGMGKIDILVDGTNMISLSLGESTSVEISEGRHVVQAILNGVVKRKSKVLEISVNENSIVKVHGKYSRMWWNMKLQSQYGKV